MDFTLYYNYLVCIQRMYEYNNAGTSATFIV